MEKVACQDTEVSRPDNFMLHREAILRSQYADLARAKATIEELHDNGDLQYRRYYACTRQLSLCMAAVDAIISDMQLEAELQWPRQCSDFDSAAAYHEYLRGIFAEDPAAAAPAADDEKSMFEAAELPEIIEITRLRITP